MIPTLVLDPAARYRQVADALDGWEGGPTDQHPYLAGEPIGARWRHRDTTVTYSGNPAIGLRVVAVHGPGGPDVLATLRNRLPVLEARSARAMIRSDDLETALLGATAAGLSGDFEAVPLLEELVGHPSSELAGAARLALTRIAEALLSTGADRIAERRRTRPDRDPMFRLVGPPQLRRQVVRWLRVDAAADRDRLGELLVTAMEDDDWEVRWSAVLAAHDLTLGDLALAVKRCRPPDAADRTDRQIMEATREVVGCHLTGATPRHPGAAHVRACLDGHPGGYDRAFLLLHSLRHPVPAPPPTPTPDGYCWVPAVVHWLGTDDPDVRGNPIRAARPPAGFAVAAVPGDTVGADEASERVASMAVTQGLPLRLPTLEELEMAIRGPDARRYPWGNGRERRWEQATSPWGVRRPVGQPQWGLRHDELVALGGDGRCAGPFQRPAVASVRPVIGAGHA